MSIYLPAPAHNPRGTDGRGHNRLAIIGITRDQCALRPRSYAALTESQDTRRARWGGFAPCIRNGKCSSCPLLARRSTLNAFGDRVLIRLMERASGDGLIRQAWDEPWAMNRAEGGWGSWGRPIPWDELASLSGWTVGGAYRDEHSAGFWLERAS